MKSRAAYVVRTVFAVVGLVSLLAGTYVLDAHAKVAPGYTLLIFGSILLLLLPTFDRRTGVQGRQADPLIAMVLALSVSGVLAIQIIRSLFVPRLLSGHAQLVLWFSVGAFAVLAAHFWDRRRHPDPFPPVFDKADWLWIAGLFVAGAVARLVGLAVQPPGLYADELWLLERTIRLLQDPSQSVFLIDDLSASGLFHRINGLSIRYLGWPGLDLVQAAKLPGALFGGLSISLTYATARVFAARRVAAVAGIFLLWQGLHWTLSRFYYMYAGDFLWISLATALLVCGLKSGRLSLIAGAGFVTAIAMSWPKTAMLVGPWVAIIFLEHLITTRTAGRKRLLPVGVCFVVFVVGVLPPAIQIVRHPDMLSRFTEVSRKRADELTNHGLTSAQAYGKGLVGAIRVLQVHDTYRGRHPVRLGKPALDAITSAMATVGFLWCLFAVGRDKGARLCLFGFLLFLWPAVGSYPAETDGALDIVVSRRLAGAVLFLAWMAAYGAAAVARSVIAERRRTWIMLTIAGASAVLNAYYIRTTYGRAPELWYEGMGVNRVYILRALRQAAEVGPVFFRPTRLTEWVKSGVVDLPNVVFANTVDEIRQGLEKYPGRTCVVLLPWPNTMDPPDSLTWVRDLSDVVPESAWVPGPPDLLGTPIYRIAYIRMPAGGGGR